MHATVVIVGRPNVGKSTVFNRLTRSRKSLVANKAGVTRDRIYGEVTHNDKSFILVDTGGLGHTDPGLIDEALSNQVKVAINEAALVIFVVDGKEGLLPYDDEIAKYLRKKNKAVLLAVNKLDNRDPSAAYSEFSKLGFAISPIAAEHNVGIEELLDEITVGSSVNKDLLINDKLKLAICGKPNVGKSTLINRMLGEDRVVVLDLPGTTTDSIYMNFMREDKEYTLIDTAGLRKKSQVHEVLEKFSAIKTLTAIKDANVVLLLIDASQGISSQDLYILDFIISCGRALVIAINKWDRLNSEEKKEVKEKLNRKLVFVPFAKVHFISALKGSGVNQLWPSINEAYAAAMKQLSTSSLTKILQHATEHHNPPLVAGRRVKLRYAHAGGANPPRIIIHGKQTDKLPEHYKKYLSNFFQEALNMVGTPLKLEFITDDNPYKDRKNKLSDRQIKKRKRLMSHVKRK